MRVQCRFTVVASNPRKRTPPFRKVGLLTCRPCSFHGLLRSMARSNGPSLEEVGVASVCAGCIPTNACGATHSGWSVPGFHRCSLLSARRGIAGSHLARVPHRVNKRCARSRWASRCRQDGRSPWRESLAFETIGAILSGIASFGFATPPHANTTYLKSNPRMRFT